MGGVSRIIAGRAKGHRLSTPSNHLTRPTTDRVREALFSALSSWFSTDPTDAPLTGFSFLDLYAGSGAVGLEAASRGAEPVWLVESDRKTADLIRANAKATGLVVDVRAARVEHVVRSGPAGLRPDGQGFDAVWLDPPYELGEDALDALLTDLIDGGWVVPAGLVVVERSSRSRPPAWPGGVVQQWTRRYGETTLHFAELEDS